MKLIFVPLEIPEAPTHCNCWHGCQAESNLDCPECGKRACDKHQTECHDCHRRICLSCAHTYELHNKRTMPDMVQYRLCEKCYSET
jgi:hypothetical protein